MKGVSRGDDSTFRGAFVNGVYPPNDNPRNCRGGQSVWLYHPANTVVGKRPGFSFQVGMADLNEDVVRDRLANLLSFGFTEKPVGDKALMQELTERVKAFALSGNLDAVSDEDLIIFAYTLPGALEVLVLPPNPLKVVQPSGYDFKAFVNSWVANQQKPTPSPVTPTPLPEAPVAAEPEVHMETEAPKPRAKPGPKPKKKTVQFDTVA